MIKFAPPSIFGRRTRGSLLAVVATAALTLSGTGIAHAATNPGKVVNGTKVNISAAPWAAMVGINFGGGRTGACTGSLVATQWILTAAHCTYAGSTPTTPSQMLVTLGKTTRSSVGLADLRTVSQIVRHPDYNATTDKNDVALLKLTNAVTPSATIAPIALNANNYRPAADKQLFVYGWGITAQGATAISDDLMKGGVTNIAGPCGSYGTSYDPVTMLCAQGITNTGAIVDSCQGDSGGPLVQFVNNVPTLVGVTSWGNGCAQASYPGVYARVSTYAAWAFSHIGGHDPVGYRMVASDGGIFSFGDAPFKGSTGSLRLNQPVVGMNRTVSGDGYWLVARDGGIFTFGDAKFYGSTGSLVLNQPIVGMSRTATGDGYWLVARDGGIFTFGDAKFYGSTGSLGLTDVVGMVPTISGKGYWIATSTGQVYNFGDAAKVNTTGVISGTIGIVATPDGRGLMLATADGTVKTAGAAVHRGDMAGQPLNQPIVGITLTPSGNGYWLVATDGGIFSFGDATFKGSTGSIRLNQPILGISNYS